MDEELSSNLPVDRRSTLKLLAGASALSLLAGSPMAARASNPLEHLLPFREDLFDSDWLFHLGDVPGAQTPGFDDSGWRRLDLPHDFSIEDISADLADDTASSGPELWTTPASPSPIGPFERVSTDATSETFERGIAWTRPNVGWYRKHFNLPLAGAIEKCEIRFDGVYQDADVYINGVHLGFHPYGYTTFLFDLTKYLQPGTNIIAVRANASGFTSRWMPGAGIYRHVWLTQTGAVAIPYSGLHITTPSVSANSAIVQIDVSAQSVRGVGTVSATVLLFDHVARLVGQVSTSQTLDQATDATFSVSIDVPRPLLWSVETPNLYFAEVALTVGGKLVHARSSPFGIRTVTIDASGLKLNGVPVKLNGGCIHATNGFLGAASIDRAEVKKVELMKAAGFNAVRTAHNPPSTAFLDACDALGLLVYEENFDTWDQSKTPQDYHQYFLQYGVFDTTSMVVRDRNHPSIIIWSIGNEIADIASQMTVGYGTQLYNAIRAADPTRPITAGGMSDSPYFIFAGPDLTGPQWGYLDIGDFHYSNNSYAAAHALHPDKALVSSESFPYDLYDSWQAVLAGPYVIGDFVWTAIDYVGESSIGHTALAPTGSPPLEPLVNAAGTGENPDAISRTFPWYISGCGDIDLIGVRKPQSYFRDVVVGRSFLEFFVQRPTPAGQIQQYGLWGWYDELPSWTWPGQEGNTLTIDVYTSGDRVDLVLNGKVVGSKTVAPTDKLLAQFSVAYAPGNLSALAYRNGTLIGTKVLQTVGSAHGLRLAPDRSIILASRNDLSFVTVQVVDAVGRLVPDAVVNVTFGIGGAGELAAVGNGNPHNMGSFKQPHRHTFHGQALAILRPNGSPGAIQLTASSPGLQSGAVSVLAL